MKALVEIVLESEEENTSEIRLKFSNDLLLLRQDDDSICVNAVDVEDFVARLAAYVKARAAV